jgi:hypothetical protein
MPDGDAVARTLHTDLANLTSTRSYQTVGYRRVAEHGEWCFTWGNRRAGSQQRVGPMPGSPPEPDRG